MFTNSLRLFVIGVLFTLAIPAARANDLACAALICLSGGASCSNSKYPACGPSLGQYCKLLGLVNGFGKATNWLGQCKSEGAADVASFATHCTKQRIFGSLYTTDGDGNVYATLDVPEVCKKFPQQIQTQNQSIVANMSPENRHLIQDISLLPVLSMRWNIQFTEDYQQVYVPFYSWSYAGEIPSGFTSVYNPNTNQTFRCPSRFAGDTLTFAANLGCK